MLGAGVPLVVTIDLHANVTGRMAAHADAIIGFEEYPHVDAFERGMQAGRLIHAAAAGTVRPAAGIRAVAAGHHAAEAVHADPAGG